MKIFITGATGYIGSHLALRLAESGHEVHALCRSREKADQLNHPMIRPIIGDLHDYKALTEGMQGCDQVYHVAAFARVWAKDSGQFYAINVEGTRHVLNACVAAGVKKVVFTSTGGIFGASFGEAITESYIRKKDFFNEYEGSKCLAESWVKDYVIQGLDVVIVSPTRVYGPYYLGEVESVTRMIQGYVLGGWRWIPGPAKKVGNYVFIEDVVTAHIRAMEVGKAGQTYIIGGANHSYTEFFSELARVSGKSRTMIRLPLFLIYLVSYCSLWMAKLFGSEPGLTPKWVAKAKYDWEVSPEKMVRELGVTPTILADGLQKTVDWLGLKESRQQ